MNILVIDDNRTMRQTLAAMIGSEHRVLMASGHVQAIEILNKDNIELILMDIEMPELNGYQLTSLIRESFPEWIPIIFLSANDSEEGLVKGIDAGGDDYLTKPVNTKILKAKIRAMERIATMKKELDEANKHLSRLSHIDSLTQILNRRGLTRELDKEWGHHQRHKNELSILMIDIDHFKPYNDNYGHMQGDECLKQVALLLEKNINRNTDIIARYGGEEFTILLPCTPIEGAKLKATQILQGLRKSNIIHEHSDTAKFVTISIGISSTSLEPNAAEDMIEQADIALYKAKALGRNRLICYKKGLTH